MRRRTSARALGRTARRMLGLLLALAGTAHAAEGEDISLRTLMEAQPMRVEDAYTLESGVQGRIAVAGADAEGRPGLFARARVAAGIPSGQEFEVSWTGGTQEYEEGRAGPFRLSGQTQLFRERGALPTVAVSAAFVGGTSEEGVAGEFAGQASKLFGRNAAHLNLGYRLQQDGPDRLIAGVGADHQLGRDVLLLAGGYYERFFDDRNLFVVQTGASTRVTHGLLLQGAVGVSRFEGQTEPQFLLGVVGTL